MVKIARQQIYKKIQFLRQYMNILGEVKKKVGDNRKVFLDDYFLYSTAERNLQLAIQSIIDVVQIMVIEERIERPDDNQECISILAEKKVISSKLAAKMDGIVGFRNILVHEYTEIDRKLVFKYLKDNLGIFEGFIKEVVKYLEK